MRGLQKVKYEDSNGIISLSNIDEMVEKVTGFYNTSGFDSDGPIRFLQSKRKGLPLL